MKVLVMGAGALGSYYGGLLARAGHDVTFAARGAWLERMRREGMYIESTVSGNFAVDGRFTGDPADAGVVDLVLFGVKSFDTQNAAKAMQPCVGATTAVLSIQNGIDNEEILADLLGAEHVLGGAAQVEGTIGDDGVVRQLSPFSVLIFAEWAGANGVRVEGLAKTLKAADIQVRTPDDVRLLKWQKFVSLCSMAGLTAATGRTMGEVAHMPETRTVLARAISEAYQLGRAEGVRLPENTVESALASASSLPRTMKSSMQRDLERGKQVEIEALSGAVVRRAKPHGLDAPAHEALYAIVKARAVALSAVTGLG